MLLRGQGFRFLRFAAGQFGLRGVQGGQGLLPRCFQPPGHQAVFGVDGEVAAFGLGGVVAGLDDLPTVLFQGAVMAGVEVAGRGQARSWGVSGHGDQERLGHRGVDAQPADPQVP